ncbi:DUF6894 family protein [Microvirga lotononidis]|uniref:DUF6894 domain-containing protein n=1 Tax=Microvirga lotononidis TaxID=864069 RepID=I4Z1T0_9HYPH|nr:hypothetical protein [Microvirga lotononidis]EIM30172.1 hypothetical protein MicloDRAFT_00009770 [Microvirga lotononidis]WQO31601.1 hypothetical protein U0023_29965 [Microvirga lotononidis]
MPVSARYFFHLVSDYEVIPDEEGIDLFQEEGALIPLIRALDELIKEGLALDPWQDWWLEVMDGLGRTVARIPLSASNQGQGIFSLH